MRRRRRRAPCDCSRRQPARAPRRPAAPARGSARAPWPSGRRASASPDRRASIGTPNASVLPEPVLARPHTSRPVRATGMALVWIANGAVNPAAARPMSTSVGTPRSTKPSECSRRDRCVSVGASTGVRAGFGVGLRRRRRAAQVGGNVQTCRAGGYRHPHQVHVRWRRRSQPRVGSPRCKRCADCGSATMSNHEGRTHRQRLPPPRRAGLPAPRRRSSTNRCSRPSRGARITYAEMAARARAQAAALDAMGIGAGERVAIVSHNSARLLTALFGVSGSGRVLVPINFRLVAEEVRYIVEHSGARVLMVDPELDEALADVECEHAFVIGAETDAPLEHAEPQPWVVRRGRHGDDQLHQRHHGPAEGRAADPPQHLAERHHVRLAARHQRPRRVPPHPAAVPLQRLGRALRRHRHGRQAHHHPQGRRRRDPAPGRAARRDRDVRRAGGRQRDPRRRRDMGRADPRQRTRAHGHRRRPAAHPHHRAHRDRTRLGVHPDLRPHRDHSAADDEPQARRVRRPLTGRPRREAQPRRRAGARRRGAHLPRRRGAGPRQPHHGRLLGPARGHGRRDPTLPTTTRTARRGSTPATAAPSTTTATSRSATARRT